MQRRRRPSAKFLRSFRHGEPLEPRRLLATLGGGVLSIDGTSAADAITVSLSSGNLVVTTNGNAQSFAASSVTRINASLGNGDDSIKIDFAVDVPASLNGEAGNDTLVGGRGNDTLDGGSGNDLLNGGEDATTHSSGDADHHDTVTYATRTTAITASLTIVRASIYNDDGYVGPDENGHGTGGASGETDSYQNVESIVGGGGNDSFTLNASSTTSATGSDYITLRANGGAGEDAFMLRTGTRSSDPLLLVADGGAGNDSFDFAGVATVSLIGGDGDDDFFNSSDDSGAVIDAGAGIDEFDYSNTPGVSYTMPAGLENLVASGNTISIVGNASDNVIKITGGNGTVDGAGGNDTIDFSGRSAPVTGRLTVAYSRGANPGDVNVAIAGSASDDAAAVSLTNVETIVGGSGNDSLDLAATTTNLDGQQPVVTLKAIGGGGDDTLRLFGTNDGSGTVDVYSSATNFIADGGAGNDALSYSDITAGSLIGGAGDDSFTQGTDDSFTSVSAGDGYDTYALTNQPGVTYAMPDDLEHLVVTVANATITGNDGDDLIEVVGGTVDARGGNDRVVVNGFGAANVNGGSGNDTLTGSDQNDKLNGGTGNDKLIGGGGDDSILGGNGKDTLQGDDGDDTLNGEADDDLILGGAGDDCLVGGSGNDRIDPGTGDDRVDGGAGGGDAVTYESRGTAVTGTLTASLAGNGSAATRQTAFDATLAGGEHDIGLNVEVLSGSTGDDTLTAVVSDADWAAATNVDRSPVIVNGVAGNDSLAFGDSVLNGAAGSTPATLANGGAGDDSLSFTRTGSNAAEIDYAMPDDLENVFVSSTATAKVTGNGGANRIEVQATHGIVYAGAGDDSIYGFDGDDTLYGQDGRDKIWGRAGNDRIDGGNSNDILRGEDGDDKVYGRDGNDQLSGGEGRDSLYGDSGNDNLNGDGGRDINYGGGGTDTGAKQSIDRIFKEIELLA